jgi:hypothetical protein
MKYGNVPRKNMKNIHSIIAETLKAFPCGVFPFHRLILLKLL